MTKTSMDLSELLAKHDQGDFLRAIAEAVLQLLMEADVEGLIGAGRHERSGERRATAIIPIRRNGRPWKEDCAPRATTAGGSGNGEPDTTPAGVSETLCI